MLLIGFIVIVFGESVAGRVGHLLSNPQKGEKDLGAILHEETEVAGGIRSPKAESRKKAENRGPNPNPGNWWRFLIFRI